MKKRESLEIVGWGLLGGGLVVGHELLSRNLPAIENGGVAFGLTVSQLLMWVGWGAILAMGWWEWTEWGWRLMVVGGLVNLFDRWRFGYVRDYWLLPGGWLYNNINDWLVVVGLLLLIYRWIRRK